MNETDFKNRVMPLHKTLYAAAYSILRNEDEAADCIQEAFTRLWEVRDRLENLDKIGGYALVTVRNMAFTMAAGNKRILPISESSLPDQPDPAQSPSERMEFMETRRQMDILLSRLSDNQRKVVELSSLGGLSNTEISSSTGLSDENVRVLLSRARKKLKSLLLKIK